MARFVAASLDHKAEINGDALVALCSPHRSFRPGRRLSHLCGEADGAILKFRRHGELWHPFYEAIHCGKAPEIEVAKALVPKHL